MKNIFYIKNIILLFQGMIIGTGAILPGISGGVLCVAFGIYEPMMALLSHPKKALKSYYKMFIPILIGWVLGFTLIANVVKILFSTTSAIALMLFFGLICGTLPELIRKAEKSNSKVSWTPFVLTLAISYFLFCVLEKSGIKATNISVWSYIICGAIWGLSMIIPGLSSSSILIYLGLYEQMTAGIASFNFSVIIPLLIGLLITIVLFANIVNSLYEKHYILVSRMILGIVIASSLKIVPVHFNSISTFILSLVCFVIGFVIARYMDLFSNQPKKSA